MPPAGYVYRQGQKLYINGQEWMFAGTNDFSLTGCHTGQIVTQAVANQLFAQYDDRNCIRIWAFQHLGSQSNIFQAWDRIIAAATAHGVKVIPVLHEGAGYCNSPGYNKAWYDSGYTSTFLPWIDTFVSRYKNNACIAFWEISNEPGQNVPGGGMTLASMKGFLDASAARIKQNDPNHLVASGLLAPWYGWIGTAQNYATLHNSPNMDILSLHEYDYGYNKSILSSHWNRVSEAMEILNKPGYVGEYGCSHNDGNTRAQRAVIAKQKMDAYFSQPVNRRASGTCYWATLSAPNAGDWHQSSIAANDPHIGGAIVQVIADYSHANFRRIDGSNPGVTPTSTTLAVTPANSAAQGASVTLTATVSPSSVAGTVQFRDGSNNIGSAVTVSGGTASTTTSSLAVGNRSLSAVFTPSNATEHAPSNSSTVSYAIHPVGILGIYNNSHAAWSYSSGWETGTGSEKYNGDDHFTHTTGATATITISGPASVSLYGARAPHHGGGTVTVRNTSNQVIATTTVSFQSPTREDQALIWQGPVPTGNHTVTLTATGGTITVDYLVVQEAGSGATTLPPIRNGVEIVGGNRLSNSLLAIHHMDKVWTFDTGSGPSGSISGLNAVSASNSQINLAWSYSGSSLTNYTVRRGGTVIASPAAGATSYNDSGLSAGTTYTYTVTGNYAAGGTTSAATASAQTFGGGGSGTLKVMPLGDSITEGHHSGSASIRSGYRGILLNRLAADYPGRVDFVGSLTSYNTNAGSDPQHEGRAGWRVDQIDASITGWITTHQPDVVLLHIGTNDLLQAQTAASTLTELQSVINKIYAAKSNTTVVLAPIVSLWVGPESAWNSSSWQTYNNGIATIAQNFANAGRSIIHASAMRTALTASNADLHDGVHPSDSGYTKMANVWMPILEQLLN